MSKHPKAKSVPKDSQKRMSLGEYLGDVRRIKRQSLREIEEATEHTVSNAYLSQLEKGRIRKPSPNILYSLANVYSIPYETLMEKAGYIAKAPEESFTTTSSNIASAIASENLSEEEQEALLQYLAFIRSKKSGR